MPNTTNYKFAVTTSSDVDIARIAKENSYPKVFVVKYPSGGNTYFFKKNWLRAVPASITYSDVPMKEIGWSVTSAEDYVGWSIYTTEGKKLMEEAIELALTTKNKVVHVKVFGAAK